MAESGRGEHTMQNDSLRPGPIIIPGGGTKAPGGGIPIAMGGGGPIRPENNKERATYLYHTTWQQSFPPSLPAPPTHVLALATMLVLKGYLATNYLTWWRGSPLSLLYRNCWVAWLHSPRVVLANLQHEWDRHSSIMMR